MIWIGADHARPSSSRPATWLIAPTARPCSSVTRFLAHPRYLTHWHDRDLVRLRWERPPSMTRSQMLRRREQKPGIDRHVRSAPRTMRVPCSSERATAHRHKSLFSSIAPSAQRDHQFSQHLTAGVLYFAPAQRHPPSSLCHIFWLRPIARGVLDDYLKHHGIS
jgi:hypothetical protein